MQFTNSPSHLDQFSPEELEGRFEMAPWIDIKVPVPCECPDGGEAEPPAGS